MTRCTARSGLLVVVLLCIGGCDNTVDPTADDQGVFFAIHGFLDTAADTQFVRISPVRDDVMPLSPFDADVSSTLLPDGARVVWTDSLVQLDDGATGMLFYAIRDVRPGETHRLEVRRSDTEVTRAVTEIPPPVEIDTSAVQDFSGEFVQTVTLLGVTDRPSRVAMHYRVLEPGTTDTLSITIPYVNQFGRATGTGWELAVLLSQDRQKILQYLERSPSDSSVVLGELGMEVERLSTAWDHPDTPMNIEQGLGFFGSVSRNTVFWQLDSTDVVGAGYAVRP